MVVRNDDDKIDQVIDELINIRVFLQNVFSKDFVKKEKEVVKDKSFVFDKEPLISNDDLLKELAPILAILNNKAALKSLEDNLVKPPSTPLASIPIKTVPTSPTIYGCAVHDWDLKKGSLFKGDFWVCKLCGLKKKV